MAKDQIYSSVIRLNTEDAKNKMEDLKKRIQELKAARDAVDKKKDPGYFKILTKQLNSAKAELKVYENEVMKTISTLDNLGNASAKDIATAQRTLQKIIDSKPQDAAGIDDFVRSLQEAKQELQSIAAMRAFEEVQAGITGTGKSAHLLGAEMRFLRETADNIGTASVQQLEKALEVAQQHLKVAKQGGKAYERSSEYIRDFNAQLESIRQSQRQQNTLVERYNRELKEAGKAQQAVKGETELIERTLAKINSASVRDLDYSIKMLNEQMRDMDRSSDAYKEAEKKVRALRTELENTKKEAAAQQSAFGKITGFLNRNWGAITQIIGAYSGLRDVVKGSVEAFAEMDQEMNNVRKYTGQSIEEIHAMNDEFKQMDTRTPREQLNQLAGSAGRLGIQGKDNIMDFVYAADQINLALGDDLGKGAVDQIGKLAMAFGEDDKMGLRDAMLSTGSAVNELAQNSAANAGYLVDFAARLSGVGVQAGLTQAQILGLGAAMDENMQRDEMAATALSQIITKMTTDSESFARIAGKNIEEFSNLVKTDMNAALMQFFESMNKKGGFSQLAPLFEQMGLDGTRAIGVLSTLASKIDDVRKHQDLATKAYREHTSVEAEAEIQNNTYQAKLEKARNAFQNLRIELGEKLLPVASACISTTGFFIKALNTIIDFVINNYKWILTLTASIAAYNVTVHWAAIRTRILTIATETYTKVVKGARLAVVAFNTAMKSNPWGLVAAGITFAIGAIITFITRTKEAAEAQDALKDAQQEANNQYVEQEAKIRTLERVMRDEKVALDERRKAIEKLKEIIPGYNAMLTDEGQIIKDNRDAIEDYLKSLRKQILMKVYQDKIVEIIQQGEQLEEERQKLVMGYNPVTVGGEVIGQSPYFKNVQDFQKYTEIGEQILDLKNKENEIMRKIAEDSQTQIGGSSDANSPGVDTLAYWKGVLQQRKQELAALREDANSTAAAVEEAEKRVKEAESKVEVFTNAKAGAREERAEDKARREQEHKANDAAKAETVRQLDELTHRYAMGKILYCDYVDEQERIQLEGIERRMLVYRTESLEYQKLARQREELLLNGSEESQKLTAAQLRVDHEQRVAMLEEQAWRENMTEQQKNEMLFREDMRYMDEQRILSRQGTLERINLEREIEERDQKHKLQREQYYQQQLQQVREQYLNMANERMQELSIKGLDELHMQGLLSEREYQEALLAIKAQYANYETQNERDQRVGSNALKAAQSNAKQKLDADGSSSANLPIVGDIMLYQSTMEQLKQMYQSDQLTHAQYLAAKQQATANFCQDLAQKMQAAYNTVNQVMSAASSYFSAQQEYETAIVQRKYEKEIEAAGSNQKKVKKLQEKQQKEEAAIKSKYARRAATIQMAQAVAQTAIAAINAYSSAAAIPVTGFVLAPIAAASFTAGIYLRPQLGKIRIFRPNRPLERSLFFRLFFNNTHFAAPPAL